MRFVTYDAEAGPRLGDHGPEAGTRLGLHDPERDRIVDLRRAAEALGHDAPGTMLELIALHDDAPPLARGVLAADLEGDALAPEGARVLAPIPTPRKNIFAVGLNYLAHNREFTGGGALPEHPIVFTKAPTSVIGPGDAVALRPDLTAEVDYEGELGVVIGRRGKDIAPEDAEAHIFGYLNVNDVTARDLQKRTSQWFLGKSLDTFCPMGPYLVHKSAVGWPVALGVRTAVNGEVRQDSNTRHLLFDIPALVATISAGITLEPGDIIATGTPEGVGMGFDPPRFLKRGDVVEVEIEGLGVLRNPVR